MGEGTSGQPAPVVCPKRLAPTWGVVHDAAVQTCALSTRTNCVSCKRRELCAAFVRLNLFSVRGKGFVAQHASLVVQYTLCAVCPVSEGSLAGAGC